jgi:hypothetical protein
MSTFPQTDVALNGVVLGSNQAPVLAASGALQRVGVTPRGELRVAQALAPTAELIRQGYSYLSQSDSVVCVAVALPSATAPGHTFTNNYATGGKHIVMDTIGWLCETSAGAASEFQLCMVNVAAATTSTIQGTVDNRNKAKNLFTGVSALSSTVIMGHTGTITSDVWNPLGPNFVTALTATAGFGIYLKLQGEIVIAPQRTFGFDVVAANATAAGSMFYIWHEVQLQ